MGWSFVMLETIIALGMGKPLSRFVLAFQNALLFLAAIAGALLAPAHVVGWDGERQLRDLR
jgi:hypothetical protein